MEKLAASNLPLEFRAALVDCIPHMRAFARSLTRDRERADDLVQEAAARALGAARQFTLGTNFKAWIFTILRNLYYNEGRKKWTSHSSISDRDFLELATPPTQEASLEFCDFRRAFWELTREQREALILVGASGLSYEAAAEICNCPIGTIKSRVSRARNDLMQLLSADQLRTARVMSPPVVGTAALDALQPPPKFDRDRR